jgi:hypothetical protein
MGYNIGFSFEPDKRFEKGCNPNGTEWKEGF